jgi:dihydroorotate dehydrogenase electron transfer subunit
MNHPRSRASILLEDATVLGHERWPGEQHVITLEAPRIAAKARAGSFVHLKVADERAMRRPLSIQRVAGSTLEILYKVVGQGTRELAQRRAGETLSALGPIGKPFDLRPGHALLIGGGVGIPPLVFLALELARRGQAATTLACFGSELPFPFRAQPSTLMVPGIPGEVIAGHALLEAEGVASRLASLAERPGVHAGYVTALAEARLAAYAECDLGELTIYACGPTPMLKATAALARKFRVSAQVSLEEYMACAVGGCAGCAVEIETGAGRAMKRVCVDGPLFDAASVVFA